MVFLFAKLLSHKYALPDSLRVKILNRDDYTCVFCGYKSEKFQVVDHIDGDPENNDDSNFQIICQICNLIKHAGRGCVVQGIVDLYKEAKYNQNEIVNITRELRDEGGGDAEIIRHLGLRNKVPFKQDWEYLRPLFAFVTCRSSKKLDMYDRWVSFHKSNEVFYQKKRDINKMKTQNPQAQLKDYFESR